MQFDDARQGRGLVVAASFSVYLIPLVGRTARAYLAAIPAMFLEEPDVAPENTSWPIICTARRYFRALVVSADALDRELFTDLPREPVVDFRVTGTGAVAPVTGLV